MRLPARPLARCVPWHDHDHRTSVFPGQGGRAGTYATQGHRRNSGYERPRREAVLREAPKEHQRSPHAFLFVHMPRYRIECLTITITVTVDRSRARQKQQQRCIKARLSVSGGERVSKQAEMGRRAKQQPAAAAGSRRTKRAELPRPPAAGLAESPQIVSNPIFRCEAGPSQPNNRASGDQLRCVYGPGSLYALVHDPAASAGAGSGSGKSLQPLPLPPCRAHPSGRVGPAGHAVVGGPHGRVLRRAPHHDPFLAAYVACSKSAGGDEAVDRPPHKQKKGRKKTTKKKKAATGKKCKEGEVIFRGCGIWSGWAAGANKYAGGMSCRYGCAVAGQKGDATATKTKSEDDAPAGPTLDLTWTPAVLSARALERREQR